MKRKIAAVVMTFLMLLSAVGCSSEGLNLYGELKKASAWEAVESKGGVVVTANFAGQKAKITADFSGVVNTKDEQGYIEANITSFTAGNVATDVKMAPVKMYIDKKVVYISKSYFTDLFKVAGTAVPKEFAAIKADFIGIDTSAAAGAAKVDKEAVMKFAEKMVTDSKVNLPVIQTGRDYTITLDSNQMVDLTINFAKEILSNVDALNKISNTGITQKEIDAQKAEMEASFEQGKLMVKPVIDGSKMTVKYSFKDDKYSESLDAAIKIALGGEKGDLNITTTGESVKIAKKAIEMPASKQVYTMEQFMNLMMTISEVPSTAVIDASKVITKNKEKYVPLKDAMAQLDCAVKYNAKTKKTTVTIDGKDVTVNIITQKGTSYISLAQLSKLGFSVTKDAKVITISK